MRLFLSLYPYARACVCVRGGGEGRGGVSFSLNIVEGVLGRPLDK
jgi:hypothetical protein